MKTLLAVVILAGMFATTGCATPAYSGRERRQMIARNWGYEYAQMQDDIDHALLLRPAGRMTVWNLR